MTYGIYFDSGQPAEALRDALHTVYNIAPELVYVGPYEQLKSHAGPDPIVLITPAGGPFGHEFEAGDELTKRTRATPLELAQAVCRIARTRALLDEGSLAPDYWFLVTADGSFGRVMTDPDSDYPTILHALEPIPGEPGLKVVPPPDWARTW
ncbi:hypothetical protein Aab01nite_58290 [Paractinoplanes abujensis]|uniref:Uncharacterized protein n=1 Tax=Paractinoplanes abujensis TaxID=882441 RepID=A0A7W7D051_9ACTN|nr:hypothetical protein [Actinoplanes abujensis]MBB4696246.1 hypothetical protein [Actinoplanes abujensis]GID22239.1 hypothetical protein Aab01nite_58290 [Actinoplanes abujensis]